MLQRVMQNRVRADQPLRPNCPTAAKFMASHKECHISSSGHWLVTLTEAPTPNRRSGVCFACYFLQMQQQSSPRTLRVKDTVLLCYC